MKHIKLLKDKNIIMNTKDELNKGNKILKLELLASKIYDLISEQNIYQKEFKLEVYHDNQGNS